jgi:hypothetical protein
MLNNPIPLCLFLILTGIAVIWGAITGRIGESSKNIILRSIKPSNPFALIIIGIAWALTGLIVLVRHLF